MAVRSKEHAKHALRHAGHDSFKTQNLDEITGLEDLSKKLKKMRDDVYNFHAGEHHNHFADWIRDVFGDDKLAKDVFGSSRKKAAKIVSDRVKWLKKKAK